jgi:RNA recognition motif-containing protein
LNDIKFPELHGKVCRALPYDKELLRSQEPKSNVFVKGFGNNWTHKDLHQAFKEFGNIVSARVSIKDDYESRGYGFVLF